MWKTTAHLRHQAKSHWGPLAGLLTGLMFVLVQLTTAHVGDSCGRLGQIAEEWRIGLPARQVMCVATLDGDLVYDRFVAPTRKPASQTASLLQ
ncbi:MAG TPA: hypothetical protein VIH62_09345 [Xanthobacteraceae bacterium]|jgi:hypothetical protein